MKISRREGIIDYLLSINVRMLRQVMSVNEKFKTHKMSSVIRHWSIQSSVNVGFCITSSHSHCLCVNINHIEQKVNIRLYIDMWLRTTMYTLYDYDPIQTNTILMPLRMNLYIGLLTKYLFDHIISAMCSFFYT